MTDALMVEKVTGEGFAFFRWHSFKFLLQDCPATEDRYCRQLWAQLWEGHSR